MINHEALVDTSIFINPAVRNISAGELTPYEQDYNDWPGRERRGKPAFSVVNRDPGYHDNTIPAFFNWMRDNHRGPWAPPREEVVTVVGGFHIGDRVRTNGGYEGTVISAPRGEGYNDAVWFDGHGRPSHGSPGYFTLVSCPHHTDPDPAHPAEEQPAPEGYIPWGPDHPDWESFWTKADEAARRAGYCDEYQRLAVELGRNTREQVGYVVTLLVDVVGPRGFTISQREAERVVETLVGTTIRGDVAVRSVHLNSVQNNNDRQPASGD